MKTPRFLRVCGAAIGRTTLPLLGLVFVLGTASPLTAQTVISGGGNYISGTTFYLGAHTGSPSGFKLVYNDTASDAMTFHTNRLASWLWENFDGTTIWQSMRLDAANNLILYNGINEGVKLNPVAKTLTLGGSSGAILTASGSALSTNGAFTVTGAFTASSGITNTNGTLTGGTTGLTLDAGGTNQNITLTPSGSGGLVVSGNSTGKTLATFSTGPLAGDINTYFRVNAARSDSEIQVKSGAGAVIPLSLQPDGGNVGIGTTSPSAPLEVSKNGSHFSSLLTLSDTNTSTVGQGLVFKTAWSNSVARNWAIQFQSVSGSDFAIKQSSAQGGDPLTAGAERFYIQNGGNVGIGTTSPGQSLTVSGVNGAPAASGNAADGVARFASSATSLVLDTGVSGGGTPYAWLQSRNGTTYASTYNLSLNPNGGNVGIGTPTPGAKLHVYAGATTGLVINTANQGPWGLIMQNLSATGSGLRAYQADAGFISFNNNYPTGANITLNQNDGNVGIGTTTPGAKLAVAGGDLLVESGQGRFKGWSNGGSGLGAEVGISGGSGYLLTYDRTAGVYGTTMVSSGATYVNVNNNGNVGIGTTAPVDKLHVAGNVLVDGSKAFVARYTSNDSYRGHLSWDHIQLGNNGNNYIVAGNTTAGGSLGFVVNNTNDLTGLYADTNKNGTVAMQITGAGNVGIGTTSPRTSLDVNGGISQTYGGANQYYQSAGNEYWRIYPAYSDGAYYITRGVQNPSGTGALDLYKFKGNGTLDILNGGLTTTGNVGIGTTTPNEPLEIAGSGRVFVGNGAGASRKGLLIDAVEDGTYVRLHPYDYGTSSSMNLVISPYGGGNVGIGTINPTQKLSVAGTIRAYEVIVDTGWADYVFEDSYHLAPLSEVEQHIKAEKHLPGIPSAQEIAEHGVSMGDMQSKLLSKIEELTLHMIQQEKRINKLEQENRQLRVQAANP